MPLTYIPSARVEMARTWHLGLALHFVMYVWVFTAVDACGGYQHDAQKHVMHMMHATGMLVAATLAIKLCWSHGAALIATGAYTVPYATHAMLHPGCCRVAYISWAITAARVALPHRAAHILANPIPHSLVAAVLGKVPPLGGLIVCVHIKLCPQLPMKQHLVVQAATTIVCWWTSFLGILLQNHLPHVHALHPPPMQALAAAVLATAASAIIDQFSSPHRPRVGCTLQTMHWCDDWQHSTRNNHACRYATGAALWVCQAAEWLVWSLWMPAVNAWCAQWWMYRVDVPGGCICRDTCTHARRGRTLRQALRHPMDADAAQRDGAPSCSQALRHGGASLRAALCSQDEAVALASMRLLLEHVHSDPSALAAMAQQGVLLTLTSIPLCAEAPYGVRLAALATMATLADALGAHATIVKVCAVSHFHSLSSFPVIIPCHHSFLVIIPVIIPVIIVTTRRVHCSAASRLDARMTVTTRWTTLRFRSRACTRPWCSLPPTTPWWRSGHGAVQSYQTGLLHRPPPTLQCATRRALPWQLSQLATRSAW